MNTREYPILHWTQINVKDMDVNEHERLSNTTPDTN
jgi:hypothetical protein